MVKKAVPRAQEIEAPDYHFDYVVEEDGTRNYNFVQLSKGYIRQMGLLGRKSAVAHELLMYFVDNMGRGTNAVIVSYNTLMEITGCTKATISRCINILKNDNWIDVVKVGGSYAYCVNARAYWQATRGEKRYAIFNATVIASEHEQASSYPEKAKEKLIYVPIVDMDRKKTKFTVTNEELPPPDQGEMDIG